MAPSSQVAEPPANPARFKGFGDIWTWTSICADTKLAKSYLRLAALAEAAANDSITPKRSN